MPIVHVFFCKKRILGGSLVVLSCIVCDVTHTRYRYHTICNNSLSSVTSSVHTPSYTNIHGYFSAKKITRIFALFIKFKSVDECMGVFVFICT